MNARVYALLTKLVLSITLALVVIAGLIFALYALFNSHTWAETIYLSLFGFMCGFAAHRLYLVLRV